MSGKNNPGNSGSEPQILEWLLNPGILHLCKRLGVAAKPGHEVAEGSLQKDLIAHLRDYAVDANQEERGRHESMHELLDRAEALFSTPLIPQQSETVRRKVSKCISQIRSEFSGLTESSHAPLETSKLAESLLLSLEVALDSFSIDSETIEKKGNWTIGF